jgi:hypothetical protein
MSWLYYGRRVTVFEQSYLRFHSLIFEEQVANLLPQHFFESGQEILPTKHLTHAV